MSRIGYARVSSTGQSLEVQLKKLSQAECDRIYQEKLGGQSADRPELQSCINHLKEGDTLIITRLDRLARSVAHLAQLAKRFQRTGIHLLVTDQNIDTSTSTGRLILNILTEIAEFENDLRIERQAEGIAKAMESGVKFGRPRKLTETRKHEIYSRRMAGASIGQLTKEFNLGEASIYRAIRAVKLSGFQSELKTTKVILWLRVENNSKFVRGKGKSRQHIEDYCLTKYHVKKLEKDGWEYELTIQYTDDQDLDNQINDLEIEMSEEADMRNGFVECSFTEVGTDRSW